MLFTATFAAVAPYIATITQLAGIHWAAEFLNPSSEHDSLPSYKADLAMGNCFNVMQMTIGMIVELTVALLEGACRPV